MAIQVGISISEFDLVTPATILKIAILNTKEKDNKRQATQEDFDNF